MFSGIILLQNDHLLKQTKVDNQDNRFITNFVVNLLAGLIAYCHRPKKPSIATDDPILSTSA